MSLRFGSGSGSFGDEDSSTMTEDRTMYSRHTCYQTQLLEAFYREYPQPNDEQLGELSREIGLDVKQIKFWYHNNPPLTKWGIQSQVDRADNGVLREENEKIRFENEALKESLNTILCTPCGGPSLTQHQRNSNLHKLLTENANLKQQYWKLSKVMAKYTGKVHLLSVDSPFTRRRPCCVMNEADGRILGIPTRSTQSVSVMMNSYNNNNNNVDQEDAGILGIPTSSTLAAPPLMMNNAAPPNHQQLEAGIFGANHNAVLEQVMDETDNNNAAAAGVGVAMDKEPTPLAELMKLLA